MAHDLPPMGSEGYVGRIKQLFENEDKPTPSKDVRAVGQALKSERPSTPAQDVQASQAVKKVTPQLPSDPVSVARLKTSQAAIKAQRAIMAPTHPLHERFFPQPPESEQPTHRMFPQYIESKLKAEGKWTAVMKLTGCDQEGHVVPPVGLDALEAKHLSGAFWPLVRMENSDFENLKGLILRRDAAQAEKNDVLVEIYNEALKKAFGPDGPSLTYSEKDGGVIKSKVAMLVDDKGYKAFTQPKVDHRNALDPEHPVVYKPKQVLVHTAQSLAYMMKNRAQIEAYMSNPPQKGQPFDPNNKAYQDDKGRVAYFELLGMMALETHECIHDEYALHSLKGIGQDAQSTSDAVDMYYDSERNAVRFVAMNLSRAAGVDVGKLESLKHAGTLEHPGTKWVSPADIKSAEIKRVYKNMAGGMNNSGGGVSQAEQVARAELQEEAVNPVFTLTAQELQKLQDDVVAAKKQPGAALSETEEGVLRDLVAELFGGENKFSNPDERFEKDATRLAFAKEVIQGLYEQKVEADLAARVARNQGLKLAIVQMKQPMSVLPGPEGDGKSLNILDKRAGEDAIMVASVFGRVAPSEEVVHAFEGIFASKTLESKGASFMTLGEMIEYAQATGPDGQPNGFWSGHIIMYLELAVTAIINGEIPKEAAAEGTDLRKAAEFVGFDMSALDAAMAVGKSKEEVAILNAQKMERLKGQAADLSLK